MNPTTLGIMQPYFFPYIGYFSLIQQADAFILFDTPQFIRHGWIERNRILKPNGESLYIRVPLKKHARETPINQLILKNEEPWKNKLLAQLVPYKKKAPHYWKVVKLVKEALAIETTSIVALNYHTLKAVCHYLEIATPITVWSEMKVEIEEVTAPDEWALNICKALGSTNYVNPIGGLEFFDRQKYEEAQVKIDFLKPISVSYQQLTAEYNPFLSIIDVLMFNSVEEVQSMLKSYELV